MAHAKNLGEPFMAHLENLYDIPCTNVIYQIVGNKVKFMAVIL